jgi:DnaJ-class molecular chaperone
MNSATDGDTDARAESGEPRECMACRGGGEVISHLGGTAKTVTCPWCEGTGVRGATSDAQAKWKGPDEATEGA